MIAVSLWLVWVLGRRFKNYYDVMIAAIVGLIQLGFVLVIENLSEYKDPGFAVSMKIIGYLLFGVLLLSPTVYYVLFYVAIFTVTYNFVVTRHYEEKTILIQFGLMMVVTFVTFWYLFHKRELKRFFQQ